MDSIFPRHRALLQQKTYGLNEELQISIENTMDMNRIRQSFWTSPTLHSLSRIHWKYCVPKRRFVKILLCVQAGNGNVLDVYSKCARRPAD
ncbi:unnamed protein product [Albugo candida]|uniref:Uncharacterized protein n=1 Tax=Albugo candida TaxID=65357 RepID=A0A024G4R6_9STRA|nr:unnamed protein product [Albugo candida]|eukprot:CCI41538.1 unnamed protein product [Albugo candida]